MQVLHQAGVVQLPHRLPGEDQSGEVPAVGAGGLGGERGVVTDAVQLPLPALGGGAQQPQQQGEHQGSGRHHAGTHAPRRMFRTAKRSTPRPAVEVPPLGVRTLSFPLFGLVLPPGLAQKQQAQRQGQDEHRQGAGQSGPDQRGVAVIQRLAQAHRRLAVAQVGGIEPLGRRQGHGNHPVQQQPAGQPAQQGGSAGEQRAAGEEPEGNFPLGGTQRGENLHRLPLAAHKQEGEEHQHRQGAGRGGQRDGQGGGAQGLQGLGGGGIALVIEGDPHLIGHHGLEGLHGLPPLGVVQHRPAQLVAV